MESNGQEGLRTFTMGGGKEAGLDVVVNGGRRKKVPGVKKDRRGRGPLCMLTGWGGRLCAGHRRKRKDYQL